MKRFPLAGTTPTEEQRQKGHLVDCLSCCDVPGKWTVFFGVFKSPISVPF